MFLSCVCKRLMSSNKVVLRFFQSSSTRSAAGTVYDNNASPKNSFRHDTFPAPQKLQQVSSKSIYFHVSPKPTLFGTLIDFDRKLGKCMSYSTTVNKQVKKRINRSKIKGDTLHKNSCIKSFTAFVGAARTPVGDLRTRLQTKLGCYPYSNRSGSL